MEITICGSDISELKEKLIGLCKVLGLEVHDPQLALPLEKKSKKITKKEEPAPVVPSVTNVAPVETAPTKEEAKTALEKVTQEKSMNAGHSVVLKFGVNRFSEIPEDKYSDLIAECNKLLGTT